MEIDEPLGSTERAYQVIEYEMYSLLMDMIATYPNLSREEIAEMIRLEANAL